jgi:hypothetical protein
MTSDPFELPDIQQILIAAQWLEYTHQPLTAELLEHNGCEYFGIYQRQWNNALAELIQRGLVISTENGYQLSETARQQAERLWQEHPKSFYTYSEFFVRAPASAAHSRFCEMVYGIDLVQHDMMPIDQLHLLLERLELKPGDRLLELGCGCGRVAAYVAGRTGASVKPSVRPGYLPPPTMG